MELLQGNQPSYHQFAISFFLNGTIAIGTHQFSRTVTALALYDWVQANFQLCSSFVLRWRGGDGIIPCCGVLEPFADTHPRRIIREIVVSKATPDALAKASIDFLSERLATLNTIQGVVAHKKRYEAEDSGWPSSLVADRMIDTIAELKRWSEANDFIVQHHRELFAAETGFSVIRSKL